MQCRPFYETTLYAVQTFFSGHIIHSNKILLFSFVTSVNSVQSIYVNMDEEEKRLLIKIYAENPILWKSGDPDHQQ